MYFLFLSPYFNCFGLEAILAGAWVFLLVLYFGVAIVSFIESRCVKNRVCKGCVHRPFSVKVTIVLSFRYFFSKSSGNSNYFSHLIQTYPYKILNCLSGEYINIISNI